MNELEQLLTASITIERLKTESKLAADAICALSQENALLKARLAAVDAQFRKMDANKVTISRAS